MNDGKHLLLKHPFTALAAGPTGSGKTVLVRRLLGSHRLTTTIKDEKLRVLWCYGQYQDLYNKPLGTSVEITYVKNLPSSETISEIKPHLIVLDDLMTEMGNNKDLTDLFTKGSHHLGLSVLFIVQNLFHQGAQMRTISLNCRYMILLKSVRDKQQISSLGRQLYPEKPAFLNWAYNEATAKPYGYLLIDLTPDTPDKWRLRTRLTPEENINGIIRPIYFEK